MNQLFKWRISYFITSDKTSFVSEAIFGLLGLLVIIFMWIIITAIKERLSGRIVAPNIWLVRLRAIRARGDED